MRLLFTNISSRSMDLEILWLTVDSPEVNLIVPDCAEASRGLVTVVAATNSIAKASFASGRVVSIADTSLRDRDRIRPIFAH